MEANRRRWPGIILALVTILVFARVCGFDFSWWDDWQTVHQNPWLRVSARAALVHFWTRPAYGLYIPVTYTAWIGMAAVSSLQQADPKGISLNPWIFHSANLLVHVIASLLCFVLLRMLLKKELPALLGAMLFAIHPVQVESVAWVSGLKDVLAGALSLAALCRYVWRAQKDQTGETFVVDPLGTLLFLFAMLAKPSATMLPLIALCVDHWIVGRNWKVALRSAAMWLILAIPLMVVARIVQNVDAVPAAPLWARPLVATDALTFYLYKIICPIWLGVEYGRRPLVIMHHPWFYLSWIPVALVALIVWRIKSRPLLAAAMVFVLAILPMSGLATFEFQGYSTTADHYLYFAMIGPALALGLLVSRWDRTGVRATVVVALALLGVRSFLQTSVWRDDFALFGNALRVNPNGFLSHHNLGCAYYTAGDYEHALAEYQAAMALNPDFVLPFDNAATLLAARGDIDGAIAASEHSLEVRARTPGMTGGTYIADEKRVAALLMQQGKYGRAAKHYEAVLKLKPDDADAKAALQTIREN